MLCWNTSRLIILNTKKTKTKAKKRQKVMSVHLKSRLLKTHNVVSKTAYFSFAVDTRNCDWQNYGWQGNTDVGKVRMQSLTFHAGCDIRIPGEILSTGERKLERFIVDAVNH